MTFLQLPSDVYYEIIQFLEPKEGNNWFLTSKTIQKFEEKFYQNFLKTDKPSFPCIFTSKQYFYKFNKKNSNLFTKKELNENINNLEITKEDEDILNWKNIPFFKMIKVIIENNHEMFFKELLIKASFKFGDYEHDVLLLKLFEMIVETKEKKKISTSILRLFDIVFKKIF